mmetsp:Transcript_81835/g.265236  ORF Transcript_81835/g.265236 Transcript_81835/m.265236 type:complete len:203 (-) Transcript_81835:496-1104(-)
MSPAPSSAPRSEPNCRPLMRWKRRTWAGGEDMVVRFRFCSALSASAKMERTRCCAPGCIFSVGPDTMTFRGSPWVARCIRNTESRLAMSVSVATCSPSVTTRAERFATCVDHLRPLCSRSRCVSARVAKTSLPFSLLFASSLGVVWVKVSSTLYSLPREKTRQRLSFTCFRYVEGQPGCATKPLRCSAPPASSLFLNCSTKL